MRPIAILMLSAAVAGWAGGAAAAESWGLPREEKARFEATVVDVRCELADDCPADCGGGGRQLGLLRRSGELVLPLKNMVPFAGAAAELLEFCGRRVVADGLFSTNRGVRVFALQFVREVPDGDWRRANRWLGRWADRNGIAIDGPKARQWFRHDPAVGRIIGRDGPFGLGDAR